MSFPDHKIQEIQEIQEENSKSTASELGSRKLSPILDADLYRKLKPFKDKLWKEYNKKSSLSYVGIILADGEPVIHAVVNRNRSGPYASLPNKLGGYSVIFSYGSVEPDHRNYHKELKPGISIGRSTDPPNVCTLGVLFQEEGSGDVFLLTTKHGTGEESIVFQPGKLDSKTSSTICAKVTYSFLGTDDSGHLLDYSFCKMDKCRTIPTIPNVPLRTDIAIKSCKLHVTNEEPRDFHHIHKVGRTTFHTEAWVSDNYDGFMADILSQDEEVSGIVVISTGGCIFAQNGDSGSAIFDKEGILWGIHHGSSYPYHFIIPIHLILEDVNNRFGVKFNLM